MTKNREKIKSYSRKIGKNLTALSKSLLLETLPQYQVSVDNIRGMQNLNIEIGFGDGENVYNMATNDPEKNFLGIEVYLNGVCNLLKLCKERPLSNLFIHPQDADLLLNHLPDSFV